MNSKVSAEYSPASIFGGAIPYIDRIFTEYPASECSRNFDPLIGTE